MDKLKTLQTAQWKDIDSQADHIVSLISKAQNESKNRIAIKGKLNKVNRAILEQNNFKVIEDSGLYYPDYFESYIISW